MTSSSAHSRYQHPLVTRYGSPQMSKIWSDDQKFSTWRQLWLALARAEQELGLPISDTQLSEMAANLDNIDYKRAAEKEREFRHDVMAHVHTFGEAAPSAAPIIHLGATSCYVTDNADLVQTKLALEMISAKLLHLMKVLRDQAVLYKDVPTLGFTHFQPAQLTTVGKRMTLWLQDFQMDFDELQVLIAWLPFRGVKGTTGTQASFLDLFEGDHDRVKQLNAKVTSAMGFERAVAVSGQTYTRKIDTRVVNVLSGIASSSHKMCTDIRLLASMKEIEEPFGKSQIGSSAMAYKRNPMRSERVCALARYVQSLQQNTVNTHSTQWLERTLDDSANRRMVLPESFLGADAILDICGNIIDGVQVWPHVIRKHVMAELPFMATENILMECVKHGGDRQELHEVIRELSMEAGKRVKVEGADNDLLERIARDDRFAAIHDQLDDITDPAKFTGRAAQQVDDYVRDEIDPILEANKALLDKATVAELKV